MRRILAIVLVVTLIIVGVFAGVKVYLWQKTQLVVLQKEVRKLGKEDKSFKEELKDLQRTNSSFAGRVKLLEENKNSLEQKIKQLEEANSSLQESQSRHREMPSRGGRRIVVVATAYSPQDPGVDGTTSTGAKVQEGRTVAVDPKVIPYGSRIFIPGYGWRVAEDCGGAIKGNRIDLFFSSKKEALSFGRQRVEIFVYR